MPFVDRIQAGNEVMSKRSGELQNFLSQDPRVHGGIPGTLAERKEWAAALLWLDSNAPVLLTDLQALPEREVATLMSCLTSGPTSNVPDLVC